MYNLKIVSKWHSLIGLFPITSHSFSALSILTILLDKCQTKSFNDMNILIKVIKIIVCVYDSCFFCVCYVLEISKINPQKLWKSQLRKTEIILVATMRFASKITPSVCFYVSCCSSWTTSIENLNALNVCFHNSSCSLFTRSVKNLSNKLFAVINICYKKNCFFRDSTCSLRCMGNTKNWNIKGLYFPLT